MSESVSVIIVTHNGRAILDQCLSALHRGSRTPDEVIVVDNDSTDGTTAWLAAAYPDVVMIACSANLGFAAANNAGIRASRGSLIMTLNNDAYLEEHALERLGAAAEDRSTQLGGVMSTMVFAANPTVITSRGLEVLTNGVVRDAGMGEAITAERAPYPVFGPSAGAALYRREALDDVGLFDPAFFMYLEDADLAWRLRLRGWESVTVPGAIVRHTVSATAGYGSPRKAYYLARNRWWCIAKNMPARLLREYAPSIARYDAAAVAYALATGDRASLTGRSDAFRDKSVLRHLRRIGQARSTASDEEIRTWLQPAPSVTATLHERRLIQQLIGGENALRSR